MSLPHWLCRLCCVCLSAGALGVALPSVGAEPAAAGERPSARPRAGGFAGRQQSFEAPSDAPPRPGRVAAEPAHSLPKPGAAAADRAAPSGWGAFFSVATSLMIVIGLFGGVAWLLRQNLPGSGRMLPKEVFENLGRAPLLGRQQVCLLRCGRQLLLAAAAPGSVEPLLTIDQPEEVERLVALCKQKDPHSASGAFDRILRQLTRETKTPELGATGRAATARPPLRAGAAEGDDA